MSKKEDKILEEVKDLSGSSENPFLKYEEEIKELRSENYALRNVLEQYGIEEYSILSDIEYICFKTIEDLKKLSDTVGLTEQDTKILDTVHKNLKRARGEWEKKEIKGKALPVGELLKIVEGDGGRKKSK